MSEEKTALQDTCSNCGKKRSVHRFDTGCQFRQFVASDFNKCRVLSPELVQYAKELREATGIAEPSLTQSPIARDYGISPGEARKVADAESALRVTLRKASEKAEGDNAVKAWREAREKLPFDCRFGFRFCSSRFRCGGCQPYSLCSVGKGEQRCVLPFDHDPSKPLSRHLLSTVLPAAE